MAHHRAISQLNKGSGKRDGVESVTDPTAVQYTASVGIGSPATQCINSCFDFLFNILTDILL